MKRFILSVLFAAVFCIGLGALVEKTGAKFKSDEKALALVRQARQALGGESAVSSVKSLSITGKTTRIIRVDGVARNEENETEIAMRLPNEMMKSFKSEYKTTADASSDKTFERHIQVESTGDGNAKFKVIGDGNGAGDGKSVSKVILRKDDGTTQVIENNGDNAAAGNVMIRKTEGGAVFKTEKDGKITGPDGVTHDVVIKKMDDGNATFTSQDGKTFTVTTGSGAMVRKEGSPDEHQKIMMNHAGGTMVGRAASNGGEMTRLLLGLLLTAPENADVDYQLGGEADIEGTSCNVVVAGIGGTSYKIYLGKSSNLPVMIAFAGPPAPQVFTFRTKAPDGTVNTNDMAFTRKVAPDAALAQYQIRFSDFRTVDGVQLPSRWTTTVNGELSETFDVTSYNLNPANIADKFGGSEMKLRVKKDGN